MNQPGELSELSRAIGRLEATTASLSSQLAQNHEDMKELLGTQRGQLQEHDTRLDTLEQGAATDRVRIKTAVSIGRWIVGLLAGIATFLGAERILQWFGKS